MPNLPTLPTLSDQIETALNIDRDDRYTQQCTRLKVAAVYTDPHLKPLPKEQKDIALRSTAQLRGNLQALLQAEKQARVQHGRYGILDSSQLYKVPIGEDRVFRRSGIAKTLDTAVHILLDSSGSMEGENIELALRACYALTYSLQGMSQVDCAVTAFPGIGVDNAVQPLLRFGQRFKPNMPFNVGAGGVTPLAPALLWALQEIILMPRSRKVIVIVTDGEPDDVKAARLALQLAKQVGVDVFGIGIREQGIITLMPGRSFVINEVNGLALGLFRVMQKGLL